MTEKYTSNPEEEAQVIMNALTYAKKFRGQTFVIKIGGSVLDKPKQRKAFAEQLAVLELARIRPVIVHGGGKDINEALKEKGIKPVFEHGRRITDTETMRVVQEVLLGTMNPNIVSLLNDHDASAEGMSGIDGNLLQLQPIPELGRVATVQAVRVKSLQRRLEDDIIPVVAPIGHHKGETYNVNADEVAEAIARALRASKLIFVSDVSGVLSKGETIQRLTPEIATRLKESKELEGGMLRKVEASFDALRDKEVWQVHLVDGRRIWSLIREVFTSEGSGTEIVLK